MHIQKHENGWSFADEHEHADIWYLVYADNKIVNLFVPAEKSISTSANLFVGMYEECEQHILDNALIYVIPEVIPSEEVYVEPES